MKSYKANQPVDPGVYFCVRRLAFRSMEEEGVLKGAAGDVYRRVPAFAMLLVGPLLGLVFLLFLPFVGIVMTARVLVEKLRARSARAPARELPNPRAIPIHVTRHARIHAPLDKTYAMARDPEHWSDWYVGPDETATKPSLLADQDTVWMRFPLRRGVVDEHVGPREAHWRSELSGPVMTLKLGTAGKGLILPGVQDWTWEAVDGETEVTVEVDCVVPVEATPKGAPPETLQVLEAAGIEHTLANLKDYCEHVH